jgi:hypothetical protein
MLWFYIRDRDSLSLETRYDNQTLEYLAILKYLGGPQETQRFQSAQAFRDWLVSFDQRLVAERWAQQGAPQILPDNSRESSCFGAS